MVTPSDIKSWIEAGLPEAVVSVDGDGHHFYALILFNGFEGKSLIQRHRVVYDVLGDKMKADIHALSMKTFTFDEHKQVTGEGL